MSTECSRQYIGRKCWKYPVLFAVFYILHSTFYIAPLAQAQGIPLSPLQPELREEIFGLGRSAAAVGLGERALENLDARVYAMRIVRGGLSLVGLIFLIMILYAGFLWMTGGGSEEKIGKAKKILGRAFIGMVIILTSYSIVFFVTRNITRVTFQSMFDQVNTCATRTGPATCCQEWNDFQAAASNEVAERGIRGTEASRSAYETWQRCRERAMEAVGF